MIVQFIILVASSLALVGMTGKTRRSRLMGNLIGCCGQPFWLWTTYENAQWGIFILSLVYAVLYFRGAVNNRQTPD